MNPTAQRKTLVAVTWINATDGIITTIFPPFLQEQGYPVAIIGVVVSIFGILSLVSRLPAGLLYRPRRVKKMLYLSLALLSVSTALSPAFSDAASLAALRAAQGLSFGVASTLNLALLMDTFAAQGSRARVMAIFSALSAAGYAIGHFASGILVDNLGYEAAFRVAALSPLLAAALSSDVEHAPIPGPTHDPPAQRASSFARLGTRLAYARSPAILAISLMAFSLYFLHYLLSTFFPLYGLGVGLSLSTIGFLKGLNSIFGTITRPISGEAIRFAGYGLLSGAGLVALVALTAAVPSFDTVLVLAALFMMLGVVRGVVSVSNTIGLAEEVGTDREKRGVAAGVFNTAKDLGSFVGPALGGLVAQYVGVDRMFRLAPLGILALYLAFAIGRRVARTASAGDGARHLSS
ncbi:MAG: MFS transporter [Chloroflexi bacterium]|nr:MFS transporter [Chloroflexota bacterium]